MLIEQFLQCVRFPDLYLSKLNIFGFWTVGQQNICRRHTVLGKCDEHFSVL